MTVLESLVETLHTNIKVQVAAEHGYLRDRGNGDLKIDSDLDLRKLAEAVLTSLTIDAAAVRAGLRSQAKNQSLGRAPPQMTPEDGFTHLVHLNGIFDLESVAAGATRHIQARPASVEPV